MRTYFWWREVYGIKQRVHMDLSIGLRRANCNLVVWSTQLFADASQTIKKIRKDMLAQSWPGKFATLLCIDNNAAAIKLVNRNKDTRDKLCICVWLTCCFRDDPNEVQTSMRTGIERLDQWSMTATVENSVARLLGWTCVHTHLLLVTNMLPQVTHSHITIFGVASHTMPLQWALIVRPGKISMPISHQNPQLLRWHVRTLETFSKLQ